MTQHRLSTDERHTLSRAHRELDRLLVRIEGTAEVVGTLDASARSGLLSALLDDLDTTLLAHMEWEEHVSFPEADGLAGTPWATRLLRLQHQAIHGHLDQLRASYLEAVQPHLEQEEHALLTLFAPQPSVSHGELG